MALFRHLFVTKTCTNVVSPCKNHTCTSPVQCKVALITGGAMGIGCAFANSLLQCGARGVMLGDVLEKEGKETAHKLNEKYGANKCHFMKCDVTKKDELKNLFECALEHFKFLDIVVNNAGLLKDKVWAQEINVNVNGLVQGTLFGFQYMGKHKKGKGGVIVNVASIYGLQRAWGCPVYNGTKAFVARFSNAMGHDYYENLTGVKVFTICPGVTDSNMIDEAEQHSLEGFGDLGKQVKEGLASLPIQPTAACGNCLMKILCADENGSIWVIEDSECYKVEFPDRKTLRVCD